MSASDDAQIGQKREYMLTDWGCIRWIMFEIAVLHQKPRYGFTSQDSLLGNQIVYT